MKTTGLNATADGSEQEGRASRKELVARWRSVRSEADLSGMSEARSLRGFEARS